MKKIVLKSFNSRPEAERSISDSSEHEIVTTSALKSLYPRMAIPRGRFHVVLKGSDDLPENVTAADLRDYSDSETPEGVPGAGGGEGPAFGEADEGKDFSSNVDKLSAGELKDLQEKQAAFKSFIENIVTEVFKSLGKI